MRSCFTLKFYWQKSSGWLQFVFFSFWFWKLGGTGKKNTLYNIQVAEFFETVKWKSSFSFVLSKLNLHPLRNNIENVGQRFSDLFVTVFNILVPVYLKNNVKKASSVLIFFRWGLFFTQSLKILTMTILVLKCLAYDFLRNHMGRYSDHLVVIYFFLWTSKKVYTMYFLPMEKLFTFKFQIFCCEP